MALAAVGIAASATQLAHYGFTILSFFADKYEQLQDLPQQYRDYDVQLRAFISTAENVGSNPALQTEEIAAHLQIISKEIAALQTLLCSPSADLSNSSVILKYFNALQGRERRKITTHLRHLQEENDILHFFISSWNSKQLQSNSKQLQSIEGGVQKLLEMPVAQQTPKLKAYQLDARLQLSQESASGKELVYRVQELQATATETYVMPPAYLDHFGMKTKKISIGAAHTATIGNSWHTDGKPAAPEFLAVEGNRVGTQTVGKAMAVHYGHTGTPRGVSLMDSHEEISIPVVGKYHEGNFDEEETKKKAMECSAEEMRLAEELAEKAAKAKQG